MAANSTSWKRSSWRFVRALVPIFILGVVFLTLREPLAWWLHGDQIYDQEAVKEWLREARVFSTLPELVRTYLDMPEKYRQFEANSGKWDEDDRQNQLRDLNDQILHKREEIFEHLRALGNPPTKIYPRQLPLFPVIYRLSVKFETNGQPASKSLPEAFAATVTWDSQLPRQTGQFRQLDDIPLQPGATASIEYHLHAYTEKHYQEQQEVGRRLQLAGLGIFFALLALAWVVIGQRRERQRDRQRLLAQQQLNDAERLRLEEELRRQEAERKHEEVERQNLELRSQIFANIGIMAGSYAHNIKNLLVRPNDLLRRCLDENLSPEEENHLLNEVRQTLGTVTERLQQILQTVRRDPSKAEKVRIDLNELARDMRDTWADLAHEKWKLRLEREPHPAPLWIEGDRSHLQQALENLLFNARDATFEMRNRLRDEARGIEEGEKVKKGEGEIVSPSSAVSASPLLPFSPASLSLPSPLLASLPKRQALISAAAWKGSVVLRTKLENGLAILEVQDNGIGMTEEVRRRCTETHFSTKRNNALFAGLSAGMGLGLAFVTVILGHHGARLEIVSQPLAGTTFRVFFPPAQ